MAFLRQIVLAFALWLTCTKATVNYHVTSGEFTYGPSSTSWGYLAPNASAGCGGDWYYSQTADATGTYQFTGIAFSLNLIRHTFGTKAAITLDGALQTQVETYFTAVDCSFIAFQKSGLDYGPHTVVVSVAVFAPDKYVDIYGLTYTTYTSAELPGQGSTISSQANPTQTISGSFPPPTTSADAQKSSKSGLIGGVVGGVLGLLLIIAIVFFFLRRRRRARHAQNANLQPDSVAAMGYIIEPFEYSAPSTDKINNKQSSPGPSTGQSYPSHLMPGTSQPTNSDSRHSSSNSYPPSSASYPPAESSTPAYGAPQTQNFNAIAEAVADIVVSRLAGQAAQPPENEIPAPAYSYQSHSVAGHEPRVPPGDTPSRPTKNPDKDRRTAPAPAPVPAPAYPPTGRLPNSRANLFEHTQK